MKNCRYLVLLLPMLFSANTIAVNNITAQAFVDLQQGENIFAGFRRAHAKGVCVTGEFHSNGLLAKLSKTPIFLKTSIPFVGRFSIAGSNPMAPDLKAPVRSLALSFNISAQEQWRIAMNTPPAMAVSNPNDFYKQISAIKKGPDAIKAFFKAHPESKDFLSWKANYSASESFALEQYNSINAFYLVDAKGNKQAVRWSMLPLNNSDAQNDRTENALFNELVKRLDKAPVAFDWVFTLASNEDDENNPAKVWPRERTTISAGKIEIKSVDLSENGSCNAVNFDPLTLPSGVDATKDPILNARSAAYAESYRRRAKEKLQEVWQ